MEVDSGHLLPGSSSSEGVPQSCWDGGLISGISGQFFRPGRPSRKRVFSGRALQAPVRPVRIGKHYATTEDLSVASQPETDARGSVHRHQPPQFLEPVL